VLEDALRHGVLPRVVYFAAAGLTERAGRLVEAMAAAGVRREEAEAWQIERAADAQTTQGLLGVFPTPADDLQSLPLEECGRVLVCDGVSDPGNLGTLLRSALAFGFRAVILCGDATDPWAPKVVRSTAGALFGLAIARASASEAVSLLSERGFRLLALAGGGESGCAERLVGDAEHVALAVGAEGLAAAYGRWRIGHAAEVESLNAAVAGSIAMRELYSASTSGG
jgi:TrmH family RNA methyltransferase